MADSRKKKIINVALDADLVPWVSYASGLKDTSATAYINDAIRRDRDSASDAMAEGYKAFIKAREG